MSNTYTLSLCVCVCMCVYVRVLCVTVCVCVCVCVHACMRVSECIHLLRLQQTSVPITHTQTHTDTQADTQTDTLEILLTGSVLWSSRCLALVRLLG